jgi:hypothetical protein
LIELSIVVSLEVNLKIIDERINMDHLQTACRTVIRIVGANVLDPAARPNWPAIVAIDSAYYLAREPLKGVVPFGVVFGLDLVVCSANGLAIGRELLEKFVRVVQAQVAAYGEDEVAFMAVIPALSLVGYALTLVPDDPTVSS